MDMDLPTIVGLVLALFGLGAAMLSVPGASHGEAWVARGCFIGAFLLFFAKLVEWGMADLGYFRLAIIGVLGAALAIGLTVSLNWVTKKSNPTSAVEKSIASAAEKPKPRGENPLHLTRTLSYDDLGIGIINSDHKAVIGYFAGKISNLGQDSLIVDIKNMKVIMAGIEIYNGPLATERYMAPGHGVDFSKMTLRPEVIIPENTAEIIEEFSIEYDTASPSGVRHSYRKVRYPLSWTDGKCSAGRGMIIEVREG